MFIFLKLIKPFFLPPTLIAIGMAVSLLLLLRKRYKWGKIFLLVTFSAYYILSIEPTAYLLTRSLETQNVSATMAVKDLGAEVIVVLAGGAAKANGYRDVPELSGASWRRLWRGIALYRTLDGKIPLLYSGGSGDPFDSISEEAFLAKTYAVGAGIREGSFLVESTSRNTAESAIAVKTMLDREFSKEETHRIFLVTSAWHMPRAFRVFTQYGIKVLPVLADYKGGSLHITPLSFLPSVDALSTSVTALHEWLGNVWYAIRF